MLREGTVRIPAGCAISGIFHRDGTRENGARIIQSIAVMHDRSNGLGGGFAGYGIYPEYKDYYALHVFLTRRRPAPSARPSWTGILTSSICPRSRPAAIRASWMSP